ncbi:MAG: chorismate synthase [Ruminococcaceae bacterium]|nr:chorismate synthase [Oscillospiraceae bacterium]
MSSSFGERFRFTIFGQSHGAAIGVTIEGLPAGQTIDLGRLQAFLARRAPGNSPTATQRKEADEIKILSGLVNGRTCGAPLTAVIENTNTRSGDYSDLRDCPRPGHADYTAQMKFGGFQDVAGGGHFSGRLTAPLCIAGGICLQLLEQRGVFIAAHIESIASVRDRRFDPVGVSREELLRLQSGGFPVLNADVEKEMTQAILNVKQEGDSLGGVIECAAVGLPAGWGDPMFGGIENRIAQIVFGIPAIRGIEFGTGFAAAEMRGSEHNDAFVMDGEKVRTGTNHHGGVLGGITSGMPLIFRATVKPTPSIARAQQSVSLSAGTAKTLEVRGRHDPCIVPRAVPVIEAAAACALYDAFLCS